MVETLELSYTENDELIISKEDLYNACMMASFIGAYAQDLDDDEMEKYCQLTAEFSSNLMSILFPQVEEEYDAEDTCEVGGYA